MEQTELIEALRGPVAPSTKPAAPPIFVQVIDSKPESKYLVKSAHVAAPRTTVVLQQFFR